MSRINRWAVIILGVPLLLASLAALPVASQSGGEYELSVSTFAGGGGVSSGDGYELSGTLGQADAHVVHGGEYELGGGFWGGGELPAPVTEEGIFLPLLRR